MRRTIIAVKLRATKRTRELGQLLLLLLGLFAVIGMMFVIKVGFCKYDYPERTFKQCTTK